MPPAIVTTFLVLTVILVLLPPEVAAFGAGDIPDFSYLEGRRSLIYLSIPPVR